MNGFLTIDEAATRLRVKARTVRSWLEAGKLKGIKAGKQWRIPPENLEAFIQQATAETFRLTEPAPSDADCASTLVALVKALLPEGERVYLRDKGITELPLGALNAILEPQGYRIDATKVRERRREVACMGRDGRVEPFGLFELRTTQE